MIMKTWNDYKEHVRTIQKLEKTSMKLKIFPPS